MKQTVEWMDGFCDACTTGLAVATARVTARLRSVCVCYDMPRRVATIGDRWVSSNQFELLEVKTDCIDGEEEGGYFTPAAPPARPPFFFASPDEPLIPWIL